MLGPLAGSPACARGAADAATLLEDQSVEGGVVGKDGALRGTHVNASLLTALDRDEWAKQRGLLLADACLNARVNTLAGRRHATGYVHLR